MIKTQGKATSLLVHANHTLRMKIKEVPKLRMKIIRYQNKIRATIYHTKAATKKWILLRIRLLNSGMTKSRAKWKL